MKHIGILGGTFDTIHNGHLEVARFVAKAVGLDKVLFITASTPPHKDEPMLDSEFRHELVEVAVEGCPGLEASRIELDLPGPSYTYRTVSHLKSVLSAQAGCEVAISFIMSAEYLDPANPSKITCWEEAPALLGMVQLVVVPRGDHTAELARQWANELNLPNVRILDQPVSNLSSGLIRNAIRQGLPLDGFVPQRVAQMIKLRGLN